MEVQHRQEVWERVVEEVAHLADMNTGQAVDLKVRPLVAALRANGCPTFASCEGHLSWGRAQPWVGIKVPGAVRFGDEDRHSYSVVWPRENQLMLALVRVLDRFYETRDGVPHHARLVVHRLGGPGWLELSTVTHDAGRALIGGERERWLKEALAETNSFGAFLKDEFLSGGMCLGSSPIFLDRSAEA